LTVLSMQAKIRKLLQPLMTDGDSDSSSNWSFVESCITKGCSSDPWALSEFASIVYFFSQLQSFDEKLICMLGLGCYQYQMATAFLVKLSSNVSPAWMGAPHVGQPQLVKLKSLMCTCTCAIQHQLKSIMTAAPNKFTVFIARLK